MTSASSGEPRLPRNVRLAALDKSALRNLLRAQGVELNRAAELLFDDDRFQPLRQERELEIAPFSVAGLGFGGGASYSEISARARDIGYGECPIELGPYLRLQFIDQQETDPAEPPGLHRAPGESITVASRALDERDETPKGFYLQHRSGGLWLRGYWSFPEYLWQPQDVLVFCRV